MNERVAALRKQFRQVLARQGVAPRHHRELLDELMLVALADRAENLISGSNRHSVAITAEKTAPTGPVSVQLVRETGAVLMQLFVAPGARLRWAANGPDSAIVIPGMRLESFEVSAMERP